MKRTALLLLLPAVAACRETPPTYVLGYDDALVVAFGLAKLAREGEEGFSRLPCPGGGSASVFVAIRSEQRGDTARTSGRWTLIPEGCGLRDGLMVSGGPNVIFESEVSGTGTRDRSLSVSVAGSIDWWRNGTGIGGSCPVGLDFETVETDEDGEFAGIPPFFVCKEVPVTLSMLPVAGR